MPRPDRAPTAPRSPAPTKSAGAPPARQIPDRRLEEAHPQPVCGVDEAGRGPWAGPVCAGVVILAPGVDIDGVDDSKALTAARRRALAGQIRTRALAWGVGFASVEEIGELNILRATALAMRRALAAMAVAPAFALVDGNYAFDLGLPVRPIVGGDSRCAAIAAASILAKTARDALMEEMDALYPGYGFAAHKGYGVPEHAAALRRLGPSPIHRMTWAPLRAAIGEAKATRR
jgi:ribonuclease HII